MPERSARSRSLQALTALVALLGASLAGARYVNARALQTAPAVSPDTPSVPTSDIFRARREIRAKGLGLKAERDKFADKTPIQAFSPLPSALILQQTLNRYCVTCHNSRLKTARLELDSLDVSHVADHA